MWKNVLIHAPPTIVVVAVAAAMVLLLWTLGKWTRRSFNHFRRSRGKLRGSNMERRVTMWVRLRLRRTMKKRSSIRRKGLWVVVIARVELDQVLGECLQRLREIISGVEAANRVLARILLPLRARRIGRILLASRRRRA